MSIRRKYFFESLLSIIRVSIFSLLFVGCNSQEKFLKISGRYLQSTQPSTDNQILVLNPDSTFSYNLIFDLGGTFQFTGMWQLEGKTVSLIQGNEKAISPIPESFIVETYQDSLSIKEIAVFDAKDSTVLPGAEITSEAILGKPLLTDSDGKVLLPNSSINSIRIRVFETVDTTFILVNPKANTLKVYVNIIQPKGWMTTIPTSKWTVRRDHLIGPGNKMKKNILYKQSK